MDDGIGSSRWSCEVILGCSWSVASRLRLGQTQRSRQNRGRPTATAPRPASPGSRRSPAAGVRSRGVLGAPVAVAWLDVHQPEAADYSCPASLDHTPRQLDKCMSQVFASCTLPNAKMQSNIMTLPSTKTMTRDVNEFCLDYPSADPGLSDALLSSLARR